MMSTRKCMQVASASIAVTCLYTHETKRKGVHDLERRGDAFLAASAENVHRMKHEKAPLWTSLNHFIPSNRIINIRSLLSPLAHSDAAATATAAATAAASAPASAPAAASTSDATKDDADYPDSGKEFVIMSGTANFELSDKIAKELQLSLGHVRTYRFSDGEFSVNIKESVRGKDVFIIQTCAAPVNENIMELLLTIAAARRAGANKVIAVVPYFGYKYHRRGLPISTLYHSRFLWSASADLAKLLQTVGVDGVISVDMQRPGQGHEACFFDNNVPLETIYTTDLFVEYFAKSVLHDSDAPVVVISPNTENVKRARRFQQKLSEVTGKSVETAAFLPSDENSPNQIRDPNNSCAEILGDVRGADVVIVDDVVETAWTLTVLCRRLVKEGARRVFIAAPHGLFSKHSMDLIDLSPVHKVVVTDSVPLPNKVGRPPSSKIVQISVAPLLANIIASELQNLSGRPLAADVNASHNDEDEFEMD